MDKNHKNGRYIIGIDEVGRGPIAGPVAVCAFKLLITDYQLLIEKGEKELKIKIKDSKKLSKKQREKWFEYLKEEKEKGNCDFAVSLVSAEWIDKAGIVRAIQKALDVSLSKIASRNHKNFPRFTLKGSDATENSCDFAALNIFLDGGLKAPKEYPNQQTIIKGDELHPVISCASIIAKVSRDNLMTKYSEEYPEYGFENHSGYGTKAHYVAIKKHGQTVLHRRTFIK